LLPSQLLTVEVLRRPIEFTQGTLIIVAAGGPLVADIVHGPVGAAVGTTWAISGGGILAVAAMLERV
jgi:hypothetical protein